MIFDLNAASEQLHIFTDIYYDYLEMIYKQAACMPVFLLMMLVRELIELVLFSRRTCLDLQTFHKNSCFSL